MHFVAACTHQCEVVSVDFPDQAGLFAVPPLYVHHLPVVYCHDGLRGAEKQPEVVNTWKSSSFTSPVKATHAMLSEQGIEILGNAKCLATVE